MLLRIAIVIAVVLCGAVLFAQFTRRTSMFFPDRYPSGDWAMERYTPRPQEHTFRTSDGVALNGWFFPAATADPPLIVWCHGNAGNLTDRAGIAAELARRGISVFVFDWRGYGKSEGIPTEGALKHDALAAYDFAIRGLGAKPEKIAVYGESLGGPYAAWIARQHKVRCAIIENSFPSLAALGNELYRPIPLGWFAPRALLTARWLNEAGVPVLVLHSRADQVIPFSLGERLYDQLRVPKEMIVSDHAGHCDIPRSEPEVYFPAVVRFVEQR